MPQYLRIASPGVADPLALTILGVGTSRYSGNKDVIGMFSTGSKQATALLLRNHLPPMYITGNLRMQYKTKPLVVEGHSFQQVVVTYSGTDAEGKNRSSTEDMGYTTDMGTADWHDVTMAPREYVANAIDAVYKQGLSLDMVEIDIVENIRAKKDWTQVYVPVNEEILRFYWELHTRFLHFGRPELLERKLLPKIVEGDDKTRVYKKGVLVKVMDKPSVWDYNLGDELRLDESRNADDWDARRGIALALAHADRGSLAVVVKAVATAENRAALVETTLDPDYLRDRYSGDNKEGRQEEWKGAFAAVAGEQGVATSGLAGVASHVEAKGYVPFQMPANWITVLGEMEVPTEDKVLTESEKAGEIVSEPTPAMLQAVDDVWALLASFDLLNGKEKPPTKGFTTVMCAGAQVRGRYRDGTVFLHSDLSEMTPLLRKVALEEVTHHVTGAGDMSRDLQDFLFRLVTAIVW